MKGQKNYRPILNTCIPIIYFFISINSFGFQRTVESDSLEETTLAAWQMDRAYELGLKTTHDSCRYYFDTAQKIFKKYRDWDQYVTAFYYESSMYYQQKNYDSSLVVYDQAILAAKTFLNRDNPLIVRLYNSKGHVYYLIDRHDKAINTYQEGLSYKEDIGEHRNFVFLFLNLALSYYNLHDLDKAMEYLQKGKRIMNNYQLRNATYARYYDIQGEIYFTRKQYDLVDSMSYKTIDLYNNSSNKFGVIGCYYQLGIVARKRRDFEKARYWFNEALNLLKNYESFLGDYSNMLKANYYAGIADTYTDVKQFENAQEFYKKAFNYQKESRYSYIRNKIGTGYLNLNQYDSALHFFQLGIIDESLDFKDTNIYKYPELKNTLDKIKLVRMIGKKAKAFYLKSKESNTIHNLEASEEAINQSINYINYIVNNFTSVRSKLDNTELVLPVYEQAIQTSLALHKEKKQDSFKYKAFEISEKNKASVLLSSLKSSNAKHFGLLPDSLLAREKDNRFNLSYYQSQLQKEQTKKKKIDSLKINEIKDKIFNINREKEKLENLLESKYPKYFQLKYDTSQIGVSDIQQKLDDQTTLLEYFTGEEAIYAFCISKNSYSVTELDKIDSLDQKVIGIQLSLRNKNITKFSELSYELYQNLIAPLNITNKKIIIIPDGALWHLNFDILINQKPDNKSFKTLQYLIKDLSISYAYSANLLFQNSIKKTSKAAEECLAFSFNKEGANSTGNYIAMRGAGNLSEQDLPGTRKEITAISEVMEGNYYYGSFANEKNFKEQAKNYKILHLALHGEINNENPMNSRLYFTNNKDSVEDNFLHAYELYNMELNAELAVLSACNTGSGKLVKGEGIMSLGRAFTYAGCKSILISQWELSDQFTPAIMKDFYSQLKEGKTKAEALRQAKLNYLESSYNLTANPYYWAALVQLGDNSPLSKENYWVWFISIGVILILIVGIYFKSRS